MSNDGPVFDIPAGEGWRVRVKPSAAVQCALHGFSDDEKLAKFSAWYAKRKKEMWRVPEASENSLDVCVDCVSAIKRLADRRRAGTP